MPRSVLFDPPDTLIKSPEVRLCTVPVTVTVFPLYVIDEPATERDFKSTSVFRCFAPPLFGVTCVV